MLHRQYFPKFFDELTFALTKILTKIKPNVELIKSFFMGEKTRYTLGI
jgi:hypothetical protein